MEDRCHWFALLCGKARFLLDLMAVHTRSSVDRVTLGRTFRPVSRCELLSDARCPVAVHAEVRCLDSCIFVVL